MKVFIMSSSQEVYPANLNIDYPQKRNRLTTFFRLLWSIPVLILLAILTGDYDEHHMNEAGKQVSTHAGGIAAGLFLATALMIVVRQRYPRWWFDFALELNRFSARVGAYLCLLTDQYPSTVEPQSVHLDVAYPDVRRDLNRWLPLVKWFLAIPHYVILVFLILAAFVVTVVAWFAILFTGRYPKSLFEFVVGVGRWGLRVDAYASLLVTDKYPPFSLR